MISIREMTAADKGAIMEVVDRFCRNPAAGHEVNPAILHRSFQTAMDLAESLIQGLMLEENGHPVDYHYMCIGYSAEVGGHHLPLDELHLAPECRGKGYGEQMIRWAMEQHPEYTRYHLEVIGENQTARLYERMGFRYLDYKQVVIGWQRGMLGMTRMEGAEVLRARADVHYSYCRSILVPFADLCGLDRGIALELGTNLGSGMHHGPTCDAVTGALMMLRPAGKRVGRTATLICRFREKSQILDCTDLLRLAKERGEERECRCDRMVYETVELLEELLGGE